ncbi:MAG: hypothetical protein WA139_00210 [Candidatus Aenigmatarchaeota archaeon]
MKPKLFQKIAEDMKSGIPVEVEIGYGAVSIDHDFLKLLNKEFGGGKGSFHNDENCEAINYYRNLKPCSCGSSEPLFVMLNNNKAKTSGELERMAEDFNYFSKKFPGMWWQSYVNIKGEKGQSLCNWNIGSSYEKLTSPEISLMDNTSCGFYYDDSPTKTLKTAIRNCPSHGKTCKYLRKISKS